MTSIARHRTDHKEVPTIASQPAVIRKLPGGKNSKKSAYKRSPCSRRSAPSRNIPSSHERTLIMNGAVSRTETTRTSSSQNALIEGDSASNLVRTGETSSASRARGREKLFVPITGILCEFGHFSRGRLRESLSRP